MNQPQQTGGVLVVGADGFVGRHTVAACLERDWIVRASVMPGLQAPVGVAGTHELDWLDQDVAVDMLESTVPAAIINCAGVTPRTQGLPMPRGLYEGNTALVWNILSALDASGLEARFVTVSSAAVYAESNEASIAESAFVHPETHYGASKLAAELVARRFAEDDLSVVVARPFNITGPGEPPGSVVTDLIAQFAGCPGDETTIRMRETGSVRDFVDVRDVAAALAELASNGEASGVYNIATGEGTSVADLIETAAEVAGITLTVEVEAPDAPATRFVGDAVRLNLLGWNPTYSLEQTLTDMLAEAPKA
jgi:GDP-4-dehydro-6-deoxy-D-mannose reductase